MTDTEDPLGSLYGMVPCEASYLALPYSYPIYEKNGTVVAGEKDSWISQIRKGVVEIAILGMLSSSEMYGSEIVTALSDHRELAISGGTIYPLLSRLKKAGLIDSVWRESPVGPPRKYYSLTSFGREELAEMMTAWHSVSRDVDGLLKGVVIDGDR